MKKFKKVALILALFSFTSFTTPAMNNKTIYTPSQNDEAATTAFTSTSIVDDKKQEKSVIIMGKKFTEEEEKKLQCEEKSFQAIYEKCIDKFYSVKYCVLKNTIAKPETFHTLPIDFFDDCDFLQKFFNDITDVLCKNKLKMDKKIYEDIKQQLIDFYQNVSYLNNFLNTNLLGFPPNLIYVPFKKRCFEKKTIDHTKKIIDELLYTVKKYLRIESTNTTFVFSDDSKNIESNIKNNKQMIANIIEKTQTMKNKINPIDLMFLQYIQKDYDATVEGIITINKNIVTINEVEGTAIEKLTKSLEKAANDAIKTLKYLNNLSQNKNQDIINKIISKLKNKEEVYKRNMQKQENQQNINLGIIDFINDFSKLFNNGVAIDQNLYIDNNQKKDDNNQKKSKNKAKAKQNKEQKLDDTTIYIIELSRNLRVYHKVIERINKKKQELENLNKYVETPIKGGIPIKDKIIKNNVIIDSSEIKDAPPVRYTRYEDNENTIKEYNSQKINIEESLNKIRERINILCGLVEKIANIKMSDQQGMEKNISIASNYFKKNGNTLLEDFLTNFKNNSIKLQKELNELTVRIQIAEENKKEMLSNFSEKFSNDDLYKVNKINNELISKEIEGKIFKSLDLIKSITGKECSLEVFNIMPFGSITSLNEISSNLAKKSPLYLDDIETYIKNKSKANKKNEKEKYDMRFLKKFVEYTRILVNLLTLKLQAIEKIENIINFKNEQGDKNIKEFDLLMRNQKIKKIENKKYTIALNILRKFILGKYSKIAQEVRPYELFYRLDYKLPLVTKDEEFKKNIKKFRDTLGMQYGSEIAKAYNSLDDSLKELIDQKTFIENVLEHVVNALYAIDKPVKSSNEAEEAHAKNFTKNYLFDLDTEYYQDLNQIMKSNIIKNDKGKSNQLSKNFIKTQVLRSKMLLDKIEKALPEFFNANLDNEDEDLMNNNKLNKEELENRVNKIIKNNYEYLSKILESAHLIMREKHIASNMNDEINNFIIRDDLGNLIDYNNPSKKDQIKENKEILSRVMPSIYNINDINKNNNDINKINNINNINNNNNDINNINNINNIENDPEMENSINVKPIQNNYIQNDELANSINQNEKLLEGTHVQNLMDTINQTIVDYPDQKD